MMRIPPRPARPRQGTCEFRRRPRGGRGGALASLGHVELELGGDRLRAPRAVVDMEDALASDSSVQIEGIGSNVLIGLAAAGDDDPLRAPMSSYGAVSRTSDWRGPMEGSAIAVDPTGN